MTRGCSNHTDTPATSDRFDDDLHCREGFPGTRGPCTGNTAPSSSGPIRISASEPCSSGKASAPPGVALRMREPSHEQLLTARHSGSSSRARVPRPTRQTDQSVPQYVVVHDPCGTSASGCGAWPVARRRSTSTPRFGSTSLTASIETS